MPPPSPEGELDEEFNLPPSPEGEVYEPLLENAVELGRKVLPYVC